MYTKSSLIEQLDEEPVGYAGTQKSHRHNANELLNENDIIRKQRVMML